MTQFPPVEELLPHRAPMLLLDELTGWDGTTAECAVSIETGRPFVSATGADPIVVIEYMAQCVAAWAGLSARERDLPVEIGFLIGCRELIMHRQTLPLGLRLQVTASRVWGDDRLGKFDCEVTDASGVVATATLSVARPSAGGASDGYPESAP